MNVSGAVWRGDEKDKTKNSNKRSPGAMLSTTNPTLFRLGLRQREIVRDSPVINPP